MKTHPPAEYTQLLQAWSRRETSVFDLPNPLVYKELRRLTHRYIRFENPDQTPQTTALVNEAYLRLVSNQANWQNRADFLAISAQLMRQILVDFACWRHQRRPGSEAQRVSLNKAVVSVEGTDADLVALGEALKGLGRRHVAGFQHFLSIANGSLAELDTQRIVSERLGYLNRPSTGSLEQQITQIRKMLYALMHKLRR